MPSELPECGAERLVRGLPTTVGILDEPPYNAEAERVLAQAFAPTLLDGPDAQGRPVLYVSLGSIDIPALAKRGVTLQARALCRHRLSPPPPRRRRARSFCARRRAAAMCLPT